MQIELNEIEINLIKSLIANINMSPLHPEALGIVSASQGIIQKLSGEAKNGSDSIPA
jgi:hypothetical protein